MNHVVIVQIVKSEQKLLHDYLGLALTELSYIVYLIKQGAALLKV